MSRYVQIQNAPIYRKADRMAFRRIVGILIAVGAVAALLILATWQHVEAVRFGYRTDQLVREREKLEATKRQLELERASRRSPQVIEPLARRLGLIRPDASQVIVVEGQQSAARSRTRGANLDAPLPDHSNEMGVAGALSRTGGTSAESVPSAKRASRPKKTSHVEKEARPEPGEKTENAEPANSLPKAQPGTANEPEVKPKSDPTVQKKDEPSPAAATDPQKRKRPSKQGEPKP